MSQHEGHIPSYHRFENTAQSEHSSGATIARFKTWLCYCMSVRKFLALSGSVFSSVKWDNSSAYPTDVFERIDELIQVKH